MVMKSLKSYLYCFSWNCMVFGIHTNLVYHTIFLIMFGLLVFVSIPYITTVSCIAWDAFTWCANIYYDVPCHLPDITSCHVNTWHLTCYFLVFAPYYNMTYHLSPDILILDLWLSHLREYYTYYPAIHAVTWILYLLSCIIYTVTWIYSIHVLLNSWSCLAPAIPINWQLHNKS